MRGKAIRMSEKSHWRYEYKMVLGNLTLEEAKNTILLHPNSFFERYPMRKVNNIYFDTNDLSNYYDSLAGISRRSKLRFRWYGESIRKVSGNMELKEKNGMLISKITQKIDNIFDLEKISWSELSSIIKQDLNGRLKMEFFHACLPVLINSYYRYYYEATDSSARITIDYNLKVFDQRFYNKPNISFQTPLPNRIIIEIKADNKEELNLEKITNHLPFRITQNSKYISGIMI